MGKGVRYTPEFREKTVGLLAESRDSHSSETRAPAQVAWNLDTSNPRQVLHFFPEPATFRTPRHVG